MSKRFQQRFPEEWELEQEDDELLSNALDEYEERRKNQEEDFNFELTPHVDRRVRWLGVNHKNYTARLVQRGEVSQTNVHYPFDSKRLFNGPYAHKSSKTLKFNPKTIYS